MPDINKEQQSQIRRRMQREMDAVEEQTPLVSLNHVSFVCRSVAQSVEFYEEVLGFTSIKRPSSFKFHGAWLFNYGIGIHLLQCSEEEGMPKRKEAINPKDNHISFQCSNVQALKRKLERKAVPYLTAVVEEDGVQVQQLFFHDPDGHMIEICNCEDLPVLPLSSVASCPLKIRPASHDDSAPSLPSNSTDQPCLNSSQSEEEYVNAARCSAQVDALFDDIHAAIMSISF